MLLIPFFAFSRIIHAVTHANKTAVFLQSFLNCASTQFYMKVKTFCIQLITEYVGLQVWNYLSSKITATCRPRFPWPSLSAQRKPLQHSYLLQHTFPIASISPAEPHRGLRNLELRLGEERRVKNHTGFSSPPQTSKKIECIEMFLSVRTNTESKLTLQMCNMDVTSNICQIRTQR